MTDHRPPVLPDTDFHAPRYEPKPEWTDPVWPYALGEVVVVVLIAWVVL